jgi:hypothetical protein
MNIKHRKSEIREHDTSLCQKLLPVIPINRNGWEDELQFFSDEQKKWFWLWKSPPLLFRIYSIEIVYFTLNKPWSFFLQFVQLWAYRMDARDFLVWIEKRVHSLHCCEREKKCIKNSCKKVSKAKVSKWRHSCLNLHNLKDDDCWWEKWFVVCLWVFSCVHDQIRHVRVILFFEILSVFRTMKWNTSLFSFQAESS